MVPSTSIAVKTRIARGYQIHNNSVEATHLAMNDYDMNLQDITNEVQQIVGDDEDANYADQEQMFDEHR